MSKVPFNIAVVIIFLVAVFSTFGIIRVGNDQHKLLALESSTTQQYVPLTNSASFPPTLDGLLAASCALHAQLVNDKDEEMCIEEGACQRSPEKLRKMCAYRIPKTQEYCKTGKSAQAKIELTNASHAMRDHLGLRAFYCHKNQIDCNLVIDRLGSNWIPVNEFLTETADQSKKRLLNIVTTLPPQTQLEPTAISIASEIHRRVSTGNVCE